MRIKDLPYGTILQYRKTLYVITPGIEGKILVNLKNGSWQFLDYVTWKTFKILFRPHVL